MTVDGFSIDEPLAEAPIIAAADGPLPLGGRIEENQLTPENQPQKRQRP
jgi:hypothetical protein